MKRTIITIKTINGDNKIKSQNRIMLKESEGWHGTIEIKMKDGVPVGASAPVKHLTIEKVDTTAYLKADENSTWLLLMECLFWTNLKGLTKWQDLNLN